MRIKQTKIGRVCHFTQPDSGVVIEGTYRAGRRVEVMTGITNRKSTPDGGRSFDIESTTYTVPRSIPITMGPKPKAAPPAPAMTKYESTVRVRFASTMDRRAAELAVEHFLNVAVSKQLDALKADGTPIAACDVYSVRVIGIGPATS